MCSIIQYEKNKYSFQSAMEFITSIFLFSFQLLKIFFKQTLLIQQNYISECLHICTDHWSDSEKGSGSKPGPFPLPCIFTPVND